uniref:CD72 protein n=1 Tax=Nothoprocta perdicaria TaxID=30464 RepID=A0A8C6Z9R4_NOTPE
MAESVVYADLRFAQVPAGRSSPCQVLETALCEDEADSPYENVQPGKAPAGPGTQGAQPAPGPWYQRRSVPAGLLGACLLLLATLLTLGLCYWQVTRRQQEASHAHAAERGRLSEQVSTQLELEQMDLELVRAREELQHAWLEGNSSRRELGHRNAELERVSGALGMVEKELQDVQGKLNASESTVSSLHTCMQTECCPSGWVLFKGKCLFISLEKKTWRESKTACEWKSALLLMQEPWESWELTTGLGQGGSKAGCPAPLTCPFPSRLPSYFLCGLADSRKIWQYRCSDRHAWVCEKAPGLSKTFNMWLPSFAKG